MASLDDYEDDKTRLEDTTDSGRIPEGMEVNHQDDDEGGEGFDGSKEEEEEEDADERGAMDRAKVNANRDPNAAGTGDNDDEEADEGDEDEEDDEEDDDDEDDEDDDDDEDGDRASRPRKKKRRMRANRYVDLEVEVDEDEEEEEDEGEAGFEVTEDYLLERPGQRAIPIADRFEGDDEDLDEDSRDHRQFERRQRDREEAEALRIAEEYKQRHRQRRGGMGIQAMQDFAPRSVLMPGVNDPNIWCIKCKIGRERELVMSISRKALAQNLQISSAFQRDSFHGHLYVEARSEAHVKQAVEGLIGVYVSNAPILVPIEEMPDLLKSKKKHTPLQVGGWVRIKKGVYKGDLARIDDVPETTDFVTLKVVPRIDMSPKEEQEHTSAGFNGASGKKRRRLESALFRPPPKLFNAEEVRTAYAGRAKVVKDVEGTHFMNELYHEGYLIKDFKMHMIERENVNPTIDEISRFLGETKLAAVQQGVDGAADLGASTSGQNKIDLNSIKDASKAQTVLQPGDHVEIFEGSQKGIAGTVESIANNVIYLSPTDPEDLRGTTIEVLVDQVRKKFRSGDHIKVLRGKNVNESGLVLKIKDDLVTFLSDLSMEEITVFSKDIREAAEVGAAAASYGQYELHDLIQLDNETVGVIFKIEPEAFRILDQAGAIRTLRPSQVGNKLDTRMSVATDKDNYELRAGDMVREAPVGTREPRTGRVLHVWRSMFAFLHNRDVVENGGVFVTNAKSLGSVAPRTLSNKFSADLTRMNPEMNAMPSAAPTPTPMVSRGREVALGLNVIVIKGNHKGYKGIIKDLNGPLARVELHTRMRTITIERNKLGVEDASTKSIKTLEEWEKERNSRRRPDSAGYQHATPTPLGSRTPGGFSAGTGGGYGGYSSGKTPMHRGNATPFGGGFGGATPFGGAFGGATPYNSGKTPAYGGGGDSFAASSRTPYAGSGANAFSASSRTPYAGNAGGSSSWGGATPYASSNGNTQASSGAAWGSESPAYNPSGSTSKVQQANDTWNTGASSGAWGATSPAYDSASSSAVGGGGTGAWGSDGPAVSAPTPYASAPTPAAQTPYASAPTPAVHDPWDSYDSAPTPAAAPTPYQSAATPAADSY